MYLHAVEASCVAKGSCFAELLDDLFYLGNAERSGLSKFVAGPGHLQLHVAGRDWMRIEGFGALTAWVRELGDDQGAVEFGETGDFAESGDAIVVVVAEDGIAIRLDRVVAHHGVAGDDHADFAFAPALVEVGVFF